MKLSIFAIGRGDSKAAGRKSWTVSYGFCCGGMMLALRGLPQWRQ
jgi:hypothetical protein